MKLIGCYVLEPFLGKAQNISLLEIYEVFLYSAENGNTQKILAYKVLDTSVLADMVFIWLATHQSNTTFALANQN